MITETSAGGVVVFGNALLLLKKFNGDWVLPKGRIEKGESIEEAAIREVFEESGVKGEIIDYIGEASYSYKNYIRDCPVEKTVHWFLMNTRKMDCVPQKTEGFIDAVFVHVDRAVDLVKYDDERKIIRKCLSMVDL